MKNKIVILFLLLAFTFSMQGQKTDSRIDFRIGIGPSLLGTGDIITLDYENELNVKIDQYFTLSTSLNFGNSLSGIAFNASFIQGNFNVFLSPLKNNKRFDFRLGAGVNYYSILDILQSRTIYENGVPVSRTYNIDKRDVFGYNIIIEGSYMLTDKILAGLKIFTQPYTNGDINSGIMFKIGYKL